MGNTRELTEDELFEDSERFLSNAQKVLDIESRIDKTQDLYLMTWAPDPAILPKDDFENQHLWCVALLACFSKTVALSLFCLEASQKGNPHYHGFYQLSDNHLKEQGRVMMIKKLQFYSPAGVKIDKVKCHYRINSYSKHANALYYYKKNLSTYYIYVDSIVDDTITIDYNRIERDDDCPVIDANKDSNGLLTEYINKYWKRS